MTEWKTKRFVLMGGDIYYAAGGFEDYRGSYDTKEDAETALKEFMSGDMASFQWAHIADLETGEYWTQGEACSPMKHLRS